MMGMPEVLERTGTESSCQVTLWPMSHPRNGLQALETYLTGPTGGDSKREVYRVLRFRRTSWCRRGYWVAKETPLEKPRASAGYQHPHTILDVAGYGADVVYLGNEDGNMNIV